MSLHPQIQEYVDGLAALDGPELWELTPRQARDRQGEVRALLARGPAMASAEVAHGRLYVPEGAAGTVVFLHGGGWVTGDVELVDPMCRRLAARAGTRVLSVGYRLAPEHPYPAAVEDAWAALGWAAERHPGESLTIMGESAGGNLAAVCARRAAEQGGPRLDRQVLVNPVVDGEPASPELAWFWDRYAPAERRDEPDASPLRAPDLTGQAPALIVQPDVDPLRDQVLAYAARLADAGVEVQLERFADCNHGFFLMVGLFDRAAEAIDLVADAVAQRVRNVTSPRPA